MVRAVVVAKVVAQMGLAGPELVLALVRDTVRVA
jgi:hypothetical protein